MKYIIPASLVALLGVFAYKESKASKGCVDGEPDILLILGCRVRGEKAELTLQMRIDKAAEYLNEHKNTVAIACGGIVHKDQFKSEAQVIFDELTAKGIEKERIILEDKSLTTVQNFINAKKIMTDINLKDQSKIAILSSDFHLMRAKTISKRCGIQAGTVAAPSPKKEKVKNYVRELFAYPTAYRSEKNG